MTLTKAREALKLIMRASKPERKIYILAGNALDALPNKTMTDDEIAKIIALAVFGECDTYEVSLAMEAVTALKAANALYVED